MMSNLTVLALAYDWVGERVYFAARAGGSFSLWRVPLINPAGLENVFTGPSINDSSSVQLIVDPFSGSVCAPKIITAFNTMPFSTAMRTGLLKRLE